LPEWIALGVSALGLCEAQARVEVLDFRDWDQGYMLPGNWSEVGLNQYTSEALVGSAYFHGENESVTSPLFSEQIVSVVVESAAKTPTALTRDVILKPMLPDGRLSEGFALDRPTNATFAAQCCRLESYHTSRFRLVSTSGNGNWAIRRIKVVCGAGDPLAPDVPYWQASEFIPQPGSKALNLSRLRWITQETDWTNGEDGDGIHAFTNSAAVGRIRLASGGSTKGGLYAANVDPESPSSKTLAMLGNGSVDVRLILPIRLDAAGEVDEVRVSYVAQTVNQGREATNLTFAWGGCDALDEMAGPSVRWTTVAGCTYAAGGSAVLCEANVPARRVGDRSYLLLQWSVPRQSSSSMVAISDVRVAGSLHEESGLAVILR